MRIVNTRFSQLEHEKEIEDILNKDLVPLKDSDEIWEEAKSCSKVLIAIEIFLLVCIIILLPKLLFEFSAKTLHAICIYAIGLCLLHLWERFLEPIPFDDIYANIKEAKLIPQDEYLTYEFTKTEFITKRYTYADEMLALAKYPLEKISRYTIENNCLSLYDQGDEFLSLVILDSDALSELKNLY